MTNKTILYWRFLKRYRKKGAILFGKWMEILDNKDIPLEGVDENEELDVGLFIVGILKALAGFLDILGELYYKIEPDRRKTARICIRTVDEKIIGVWHENKQALSEEIDIEKSFLFSLKPISCIYGQSALILANLFASEVVHGQLQLPGYKNLSQGLESICLTKLDLSVQAELAQIEQSETS